MTYTRAILIKVDKETKKRMTEIKLNWSSEIRKFIEDLLNSNQNKNLAKAVVMTNKLFRKAVVKNFDSTRIIRRMRDMRQ